MKQGPHRRTRTAPVVEIMIGSPLWTDEPAIKTVLRRAIGEAASATASDGELAIVLADDEAVRTLNRDWRRKDQSTNVLSFPAARAKAHGRRSSACASKADKLPLRVPRAPHCLGDIIIAYETAAREAKAEQKPLRHHVAHLAVHGFLHLVGYDHQADAQAEAMEALEIAVLARIGVPNPYLHVLPAADI
jgi:probable rRNA maturation factor